MSQELKQWAKITQDTYRIDIEYVDKYDIDDTQFVQAMIDTLIDQYNVTLEGVLTVHH